MVHVHKICLRCLKPGHRWKDCSYKGLCATCNDTHNTLLHKGSGMEASTMVVQENQQGLVGTAMGASGTVMLGVVPIRISAKGKTIETHALLDTVSQLTLVRDDIVAKLGLSGPKQNLEFGTFHGIDPKVVTQRVSLSISSMDNSASFSIAEAYSLTQLNLSPISVNISQLKSRWDHLVDVDLCETERKEVTMIIGIDVRGAHDVLDIRRAEGDLHASDGILTPFGWIAVGTAGLQVTETRTVNMFNIGNIPTCDHDLQLHESVDRFWST